MHVLFYIFLLVTAIQLLYILIPFRRLAFYTTPKPESNTVKPPVSVVICAHNEAENLSENLPAILTQQYPDFEIVVIDDYSTDDTWQILTGLAATHSGLHILKATHPLSTGNKKHALAQAVQQATNPYLLLTDADCRPQDSNWISSMIASYTDTTQIVLGYSPYEAKPGLLNLLIRYETFYTAIQYLSFAVVGMPYMGVGRNLSYKRSVFERDESLLQHAQTLSGDDDLLVNAQATAANTRINLNRDSFVLSAPQTSWAAWLHQKHRHTEAGNHYKPIHRALLGLLYITHILFYVLFIALVGLGFPLQVAGSVFLVKMLLQAIVYYRLMQRLQQANLFPFLLICDFLVTPILVSLGVLSGIKVNAWRTNRTAPHQGHRKTLSWSNRL